MLFARRKAGASELARAVLLSVFVNATLLTALAISSSVRLTNPSPPQSIDVELRSAPPKQAPVATEDGSALIHVHPISVVPLPVAPTPKVRRETPAQVPKAAIDNALSGMTQVSHFLAQAYIGEPASREIRQNLPKLAPFERATQICNIEAGQQIQTAHPDMLVDTVHASAMSVADVEGQVVSARGAAYRTRRKWYAMAFVCTVSPDFKKVTDFAFKLGAEIPRNQWDAHALNAADQNE